MSAQVKKEYWSSRIGIILAVMGSAIGLGNFLRFPGLAARYGGASFLIPYIIAVIILGLPLVWAEWSLGRMGGQKGYHSSPGIFHALWKKPFAPYIGVIGLIIPMGIFMYYIFIEAWCLYYAYEYLKVLLGVGESGLHLGQDAQAYQNFFNSFIGSKQDGALFQGGISAALLAVLLSYALNFLIVYRGIQKGIERISLYAVPMLFVCAFLLLLRVLSLDAPYPDKPEQSLLGGLAYMWNPGSAESFWASLWNAEMWLAAAGQIFFSLSIGFGIIITYSSYLRKNEDVLLSGTTSASGNIFAEVVLGGMITIPVAFIFLGSAGIPNSSFALGFVSLPNVFAHMPYGSIAGFLWFFLLFIAALTSSLSMLQPLVAFFQESLAFSKQAALLLLLTVSLTGTMFIMYFSQDSRALDLMDFWVGTAFIYVLATFLIILFAWVIGSKKALAEAQRGSLLRIPSFFAFILKYISPAYLIVIFLFWLYEKAPSYLEEIQREAVARYTLFLIFALIVFFLALTKLARRRWEGSREVPSALSK